MPKTTKSGDARQSELPSTLKRSPAKAQRTFAKAHDGAAQSYGEGERATRTAYAAVKRGFEKVGDHWEPKAEKGPSDERATKSTAQKARNVGRTAEGVDENATKAHLMELARRLDVAGRSRMDKAQLVEAIQKANRRETAAARKR